MDGLSGAIFAEGIAEGEAGGMAKGYARQVVTYMKKTGATLEEALGFFDVHQPERSAIISTIEECAFAPTV